MSKSDLEQSVKKELTLLIKSICLFEKTSKFGDFILLMFSLSNPAVLPYSILISPKLSKLTNKTWNLWGMIFFSAMFTHRLEYNKRYIRWGLIAKIKAIEVTMRGIAQWHKKEIL